MEFCEEGKDEGFVRCDGEEEGPEVEGVVDLEFGGGREEVNWGGCSGCHGEKRSFCLYWRGGPRIRC